MREYLEDYTKEIDNKIKSKKINEQDIEDHLIKIKFFQHERLIHLLVTLFYGIFVFLAVIISFKTWLFLIILYSCPHCFNFLCQTLFLFRKPCSVLI